MKRIKTIKGQETAEKEVKTIWNWFEKFNLKKSKLQHFNNFGEIPIRIAQNFEPKGCLIFFYDYKGNTQAQAYGCYSIKGTINALALLQKLIEEV